MSGIVTPDVYVAGIVGALQAQLANGKSKAEPSAENISKYLETDAATQAIAASDIVAIRTYLGAPGSATTITNAIITANKVVNYFRSHTPASAGAASHSSITAIPPIPGVVQHKDVPVVGGQVTTDQAAAGAGAIVNDEPGLEEDEWGNALIGALAGGLSGESIVDVMANEGLLHVFEVVGKWVIANSPTLAQSVMAGAASQGGTTTSIPTPAKGGEVTTISGGGGGIPKGTVVVIENK